VRTGGTGSPSVRFARRVGDTPKKKAHRQPKLRSGRGVMGSGNQACSQENRPNEAEIQDVGCHCNDCERECVLHDRSILNKKAPATRGKIQ
jgi:hypothetical protein